MMHFGIRPNDKCYFKYTLLYIPTFFCDVIKTIIWYLLIWLMPDWITGLKLLDHTVHAYNIKNIQYIIVEKTKHHVCGVVGIYQSMCRCSLLQTCTVAGDLCNVHTEVLSDKSERGKRERMSGW